MNEKNNNVKVFNFMLGVNETGFLVQRESCECKCGLNESISNSKQKWNPYECQCDCEELDDRGSYEDYYMGNPSAGDCECNKACKIDE